MAGEVQVAVPEVQEILAGRMYVCVCVQTGVGLKVWVDGGSEILP